MLVYLMDIWSVFRPFAILLSSAIFIAICYIYCHLLYLLPFAIFIAICYIYCHLLYFVVILVYFVVMWYIFNRFGALYNEKSGNPVVILRILVVVCMTRLAHRYIEQLFRDYGNTTHQGDHTSLFKTRPKCSPALFCQNLFVTFIVENSIPTFSSSSAIFKLTALHRYVPKHSPNRRKFSQCGHQCDQTFCELLPKEISGQN
jgi:hypothetical protein